jgi:protein phosphatase
MGGQLGGGLASKVVVEVLPTLVRKGFAEIANLSGAAAAECLREVLAYLSNRLRDGGKEQAGLNGLGSTVIMLLVRDEKALIGQMGDSRVYLLRDRRLKQLTTDHTLVQLLIESGDITPEEVATHPSRGQLTRYVGMEAEPLPEVQSLKLRPGDRLLLCSDGLTGMLSNQEIRSILDKRLVPKAICRRLVEAAKKAGGKDNITVVAISVSKDSKQRRTQKKCSK